jgi:hypothetical protein
MKIPKYLKFKVGFLSIFLLAYKVTICQVIDMHMHSYMENDFRAGKAYCIGDKLAFKEYKGTLNYSQT